MRRMEERDFLPLYFAARLRGLGAITLPTVTRFSPIRVHYAFSRAFSPVMRILMLS